MNWLAEALAKRFLERVETRLTALLDAAHDAAVARIDRTTAAKLLATKPAPAQPERVVFRTSNGKVI